MKLQRLHVQFNGEAPRLGTGWRIVEAEVGHKWARVRCHGQTVRMAKALWLSIAEQGTELPPKKRKRRKGGQQ